jgi:chromate transport protein ChrA
MKSLVLFLGGASLFGALALGLGYLIAGEEMLLPGSVAFALAFVPSAVTLAWITFSYQAVPDMKLLASMGGSGIRMAIALGGGYFLTTSQPQNFDTTFWYWLLLFYLTLLALEITLLVRQQPEIDGSPQV